MDNLLSIKEASERLGLSVPTIYAYARERKLKCVKTAKRKGGRVLFQESDLRDWIESHAQGAKR